MSPDNKWIDFNWADFTFANPAYFWFLLFIPVLFYYKYFFLRENSLAIRISTADSISNQNIFYHIQFALKMLALLFLIAAFARPQIINDNQIIKKSTEGIDIMMSIDISGSMLAQDFVPNRLEVAKEVAINFIKERPEDRIGMVVYEGEAYTLCPLTTDHTLLCRKFQEVQTGYLKPRTAIGLGLATAVNRLKESETKTRIIILLTDGVNNEGHIDPITAAQMAKDENIRVYVIGVGRNGEAPFPQQDPFGRIFMINMPVEIDEPLMKEIASTTGGKYFRAENEGQLKSIYSEIDKMEKSKVKTIEYRADPPEKFQSFLLIALLLISIDLLLRTTLLKTITE